MGDGDPLEPTQDFDGSPDPSDAQTGPGDRPPPSGTLPLEATSPPKQIGRYHVQGMLGHGGFGIVYLAWDEQLDRQVAIKVPNRRLIDSPEAAQEYLNEARMVASLDHPHIVPVYDVGSTEQYPCFIVSKFIDGTNLALRIKTCRLSLNEAVELTATVADALDHSHHKGLVHRDIKPGNILLDKTGQPFVADFGLALREERYGTKDAGMYGTPYV